MALTDVLMLILAAVLLALILYATNDGQFRLSALVLMMLGYLAYRLTLGQLVARCLDVIVVLIRATLIWTFALVTFPFRCFFGWLDKRMGALRRRWIDRWNEKKRRRAEARMLQMQQRAEHLKTSDTVASRPPNSPYHFSKGTRHC